MSDDINTIMDLKDNVYVLSDWVCIYRFNDVSLYMRESCNDNNNYAYFTLRDGANHLIPKTQEDAEDWGLNFGQMDPRTFKKIFYPIDFKEEDYDQNGNLKIEE